MRVQATYEFSFNSDTLNNTKSESEMAFIPVPAKVLCRKPSLSTPIEGDSTDVYQIAADDPTIISKGKFELKFMPEGDSKPPTSYFRRISSSFRRNKDAQPRTSSKNFALSCGSKTNSVANLLPVRKQPQQTQLQQIQPLTEPLSSGTHQRKISVPELSYDSNLSSSWSESSMSLEVESIHSKSMLCSSSLTCELSSASPLNALLQRVIADFESNYYAAWGVFYQVEFDPISMELTKKEDAYVKELYDLLLKNTNKLYASQTPLEIDPEATYEKAQEFIESKVNELNQTRLPRQELTASIIDNCKRDAEKFYERFADLYTMQTKLQSISPKEAFQLLTNLSEEVNTLGSKVILSNQTFYDFWCTFRNCMYEEAPELIIQRSMTLEHLKRDFFGYIDCKLERL